MMLARILRIAASAVVLMSAMMLNGCIPLVMTGVGAGALVATDRRSAGTQLDDEIIEDKILTTVVDRYRNDAHVNVTSYNGNVLLTGEVPTERARSDVLDIARTTAKVRTVQSELVVGPVTDLGSRSNDTLITSKVKARFVEAQKFQINHVKVVTERGTVYLLGVVRRDEGDAAADIARTTSGVQRVVKVFEYTS